MTNAEKYLKNGSDIKEIANGINEAYFNSYTEEDLVECIFRWFAKNEKTKIKLTKVERTILKAINKNFYTVIGRFNDNYLYVDNDEGTVTKYLEFVFGHLFKFIKDDEKYNINDLLKGE